MTIWTIGHSTRALADFIAALHSQQIEDLADVRTLPGSRRYPHFNQGPLSVALQGEEIEYHHFRDLGGRRKAQVDSRNTAWRHPAFRGYADFMESQEFANGIDRLMALAAQKRTAIMCAEAVWWRCHRSMIADYLKARGWKVLHIFDGGKVQEHPFTSAARLVDGNLSYEVPVT